MAESKTEILVEIAKEEEQTQVYTFDPLVDGSPRWIMVGVPGHESDAGKGLAPETLSPVRIPPPFSGGTAQTLLLPARP
jgi:hypothetical protein